MSDGPRGVQQMVERQSMTRDQLDQLRKRSRPREIFEVRGSPTFSYEIYMVEGSPLRGDVAR
mgnify:CR=1 FL=1